MALPVSALRAVLEDLTLKGTYFKITRRLLNILFPGHWIGRVRPRTRPSLSLLT
jgi:hypothetical protein